MEIKKQFVDFKKYLQDELDELVGSGVFKVVYERNLDSNLEGQVVITQLVGNTYDNSALIPYQIDITSSDPDAIIDIFTKFSRTHNNVPFESIIDEGTSETPDIKGYTILPYFNTPVCMEKNIEAGSDIYSRVVVFANLYILFDVSNVKSIKIDGETIEFLQGTFAYTTEAVSNHISGDQLNRSKKRSSTTSLTFTMVNKNTIFARKLFKIATGQLAGNTSFSTEFELTNGDKATLTMMVQTSALSFARQQLPSNQVTLFLFDSRI